MTQAMSKDSQAVATSTASSFEPHIKSEALIKLNAFTGHDDEVFSVSFSSDHGLIASGGYDRTIHVWDRATGECQQSFTGHTDRVLSVCFSPDGNMIASSSDDGTIRIWNTVTGQELHCFTGHGKQVWSVVFSPDSRYVLSGSRDTTLRMWDCQTGEQVRLFQGHKGTVFSVQFRPTYHQVLSAGMDGTIRLWDVRSAYEMSRFTGHNDWVNTIAVSPGGTTAASGALDGKIGIWDLTSPPGAPKLMLEGHGRSVTKVLFVADQKRLLSCGLDQTIRLWDTTTGQELCRFTGHTSPIYHMELSSDGQYLITAGGDVYSQNRVISLWRFAQDLSSY